MKKYQIREFGDPVRLLPEIYSSMEEVTAAYERLGGLGRKPGIQITGKGGKDLQIYWVSKGGKLYRR